MLNYKPIIIALILIFSSFSCIKLNSGNFDAFDQKVPTPVGGGDPTLFDSSGSTPASNTILAGYNDQAFSKMIWNKQDGEEDINQTLQNLIPSATLSVTNPGLPMASPEQIRNLTGCLSPRLSLGNPVLTDGAHWKVFAKCILMTVPDGPILYGYVPELKKVSSAVGLIWEINQAAIFKHKIWEKTSSEKLNFIERLVLATRVRLLTASEKNAALLSIQQRGVVHTSFLYLLNWYSSEDYRSHFDYSKAPSPFFISYLVEGTLLSAANESLSSVNFSVPIGLFAGYKTEGVSDSHGGYRIQIFRPLSSLFTPVQLVVLARAGTLKQSFERVLYFPIVLGLNLKFLGKPETPITKVWPDSAEPRNPLMDVLNFNNWGTAAGACPQPEVISGGSIVQPGAWLRFVDCKLGFDQASYPAFFNRTDAAIYLLRLFNKFLNSATASARADVDNLSLLFSILVFREPTFQERNAFIEGLKEKNVNLVSADILRSWFYSTSYEKYNYNRYLNFAKRNIHFRGVISDENGEFVNGARINLLKNNEIIAGGISANGVYDFKASVDDPAVLSNSFELQVLTLSNSTKVGKIEVQAGATEINRSFVVPKVNAVTPGAGGEARNPDASVSILFPEGAVTSNAVFSVSPMTVETVAGANAIKFEVTPAYQFSLPVKINAKIPYSVSSGLGNGVTLIAATPAGEGRWEVLEDLAWHKSDSSYENYQASIRHFSYIYFLPSNILSCSYQLDGGIQKIICATNMAIPGISPLADVTERRSWIEIPAELPSLRGYSRNLLNTRGWNGAILDDLSNLNIQPYLNINVAPGCFDGVCSTSQYSAPQLQYGYSNFSFFNKSGTLRSWHDAQAEHCAANPTASYPQIRMNSVQASELRTTTNFNYYRASQTLCTKNDNCSWWDSIWGDCDYQTQCNYDISSTGSITVQVNASLAKVTSSDWRPVSVNITSAPIPNYGSPVFRVYDNSTGFNIAESRDGAVGYLQNSTFDAQRSIAANLGQSFASLISNAGFTDPIFDPSTCTILPNPADDVVFNPADGATGVSINGPISLTFQGPIRGNSVQVSLDKNCTGNVQLSSDDFITCHPFLSSNVILSNSDKTASVTPSPMLPNIFYKIKVIPGIQEANGTVITVNKAQSTGFFTYGASVSGGFSGLTIVNNLRGPSGMTMDSAGSIYTLTTDASNKTTVSVLNSNGNLLRLIDASAQVPYRDLLGNLAIDDSGTRIIISRGEVPLLFAEFDALTGNHIRNFGNKTPVMERIKPTPDGVPEDTLFPTNGSLKSIAFANGKIFGNTRFETIGRGYHVLSSFFEGYDYGTGQISTTYAKGDPQEYVRVTRRPTDLLVARSKMAKISRLDFNGNVLGDILHPFAASYTGIYAVKYDPQTDRIIALATGTVQNQTELFIIAPDGQNYKGTKIRYLGLPANALPADIQPTLGGPPAILISDIITGNIYKFNYVP